MHNTFSKSEASTESRNNIDSLRTQLDSGKNHAFLQLAVPSTSYNERSMKQTNQLNLDYSR